MSSVATNLFNKQIETGLSICFRRQAPSHGAEQINPKIKGKAMSSLTTCKASSNLFSAIRRFIFGISIKAGQLKRQGASQSPT